MGNFQIDRNFGAKKRSGIMTAQEFLRTLSGTSPTIPSGLSLPEIIITRRTRTHSMNGRIGEEIHEGIVKFFCRSRGHGFIDDDEDPFPVFMHISDIEGEFIPRKGDRVRYQVCPMPPRFDKPQGVHIQIIDFTPEVHKKWSEKETPEELKEDLEAMKEERELSEQLKGPGPLINTSGLSPHRRPSSGFGTIPTVPENELIGSNGNT